MSTQQLVNVLDVIVPAYSSGYAVPHGLRSNGRAVTPTLVIPSAETEVVIASADETKVYLDNPSGNDVALKLRCERGLSIEVDHDKIQPFLQNINSRPNAIPIATQWPIYNAGSNSNPVVALAKVLLTEADVSIRNKDGEALIPSMRTLGTGAAQACAGNDVRLSDARIPVDASVTTAKLGAFAVTADKLAAQAVTTDKLALYSVIGDRLGAFAVTTDKLASQAVTTAKIADSSVTNAKIANASVTSAKLAVLSPNPAGTYGSASSVPVVSVNSQGQVISVTTAPIPALTQMQRVDGGGLGTTLGGTFAQSGTQEHSLTPPGPYFKTLVGGRVVISQMRSDSTYLKNNGTEAVQVRFQFIGKRAQTFMTTAQPDITLIKKDIWVPAGQAVPFPNLFWVSIDGATYTFTGFTFMMIAGADTPTALSTLEYSAIGLLWDIFQ